MSMSDKGKEARREYYRKWRAKNKDRIREYNRKFWEKKALRDQEASEGNKDE